MAPHTRYRFSEFVISPRRRLVLRRGEELPLIPRYFDLLVLLIQRRPAVVTRREIFDLAAELARAAIPGADLPNAVRETGVDPRVREVPIPALPEVVREATAALADELDGTIGVVAPVDRLAEVEAWLGERDTERIPVLEAIDTTGLEFDGIVVVAPDEIVAESEAGIRTLYVVLTRATQQLDILGPTHDWHPGP